MSEEQKAETITESTISADQVIAFLKGNPNFFKTNPELITELNFTHDTGDAVSLIQRQVDLLRKHQQSTRDRLVELSNHAKTNGALLERIKALSVSTAGASTPKAILENLSNVITQDFGLDAVYLVVEHNNWPMSNENVIGLSPEDLGKLRNAVYNLSVFVGRPPAKLREIVLRGKDEQTASIAMTRFKYKELDTYLIIGSSNQAHFTNDMGTDFVAYIGELTQALLSR